MPEYVEYNGNGLAIPRSAVLERAGRAGLAEFAARSEAQMEILQEHIRELEMQYENGWERLGGEREMEFSRQYLDYVIRLSRLNYLKNPLINHAIDVQAHYVFSEPVEVSAGHPDINEVTQAFWDDYDNRQEFTSHQAMQAKERTLSMDANVFFCFFPSKMTGRIKLRSIPVDEIRQIYTNPEDRKEPWFYKRCWSQMEPSGAGMASTQKEALYPDWRYAPRNRPATYADLPIRWESPVYHVKVGGLEHMQFGVPETYAALDWAKAVKEAFEDYATIRRAHSRFAWSLTGTKGPKEISALKAKFGTTFASDASATQTESNPPPTVGSMFFGAGGRDLNPIRTSGAQAPPEEMRYHMLMVGAGVGLPETILTGNADVGNLATAKSLDRPTELKMKTRQSLWESVITQILDYVIDWAIRAPRGPLRSLGTLAVDPETKQPMIVMRIDRATNEPYDRHLDVDLADILERDITNRINAIVTAATLGGRPDAGILDPEVRDRELYMALGIDDVDELLKQKYDEEPPDGQPEAEAELLNAVRELTEVVRAGRR